jgi:NDP-sugar pyrophosphorylase family protein
VNVLFPMAGQGARFGHQFKPFLTVEGQSFIEAAVAPFRKHISQIDRFVFVYLESQDRDFDVRRRLGGMFAGLPFEVVLLDRPTRGPAETIGRAVDRLGITGAALVCDCDHAVDVTPLFDIITRRERYDALLPLWPLDGENLASWSVARVDGGRVCAIAEKAMPAGERGTAMGVIGCYGFADLADTAARALGLDATNFSDVLREMIDHDKVVLGVRIENAKFFGDPDRLARTETRSPAS